MRTCGEDLHSGSRCSAPGGEGTGGSFRCFCLLLSLLTKVGHAAARNSPHFNGAFFILAQLLGNCGGVSFTLRMITTRWVTSVPGMA